MWGNVVVAIFCAFVVGIVAFAERHAIYQLRLRTPDIYNQVLVLLVCYLLFAFFATLAREIIKDIEDMEGDAALNLRTVPIVRGTKTAKWLIGFCLLLLISGLIGFNWWLFTTGIPVAIPLICMLLYLPLIHVCVQNRKAAKKSDFTRMSKWMKAIMAAGLLLLLLTGKFLFQEG